MQGPKENSYMSNYLNGLIIPYFLMPKTLKENTQFLEWINNKRFVNNLNRFCNMRVSSFEWHNLPDTVDALTLELLFMMYGNVGMYRDEVGNFLCMGLTPFGKDGVSINGQPYGGWLWGYNGKTIEAKLYQTGIDVPVIRETAAHKIVDATYNCVWGKENFLGYSFFNDLLVDVWDLTERERILNGNLQASAQPVIISCPEEQKESIKRELESMQHGNYRILSFNNAFNNNKYEVLDTHFNPQVISILAQEIQRITDNIQTKLGINNNGAMSNKKERLIVDEVNSNNEQIATEIEQNMVWRNRFCEQCKEAFGLDISCTFRYSTPKIEPFEDNNPEASEDDNELNVEESEEV